MSTLLFLATFTPLPLVLNGPVENLDVCRRDAGDYVKNHVHDYVEDYVNQNYVLSPVYTIVIVVVVAKQSKKQTSALLSSDLV